jgi:PKD repeat protein
LSLLPGSNTITLTARDAAGNVAKVATTAVYVVPPTPLSPNDVGPATPLFTWTAAPSATSYVLSVRDSTQTETVHMTVTPDQARCPTGGTCAFDPGVALAAGAARWSVETIVRSDLGAWSAPAYFMVDTTPPLVEITSPSRSANFGTKNTSVTLGGSAGDNVKVAMVTWTDDQGRAGIAQGTSQWSTDPIPMVSGRTTFTVTALDAAGNIATDTITVYGAAQLSTLR